VAVLVVGSWRNRGEAWAITPPEQTSVPLPAERHHQQPHQENQRDRADRPADRDR
jgi:hypothetical protein